MGSWFCFTVFLINLVCSISGQTDRIVFQNFPASLSIDETAAVSKDITLLQVTVTNTVPSAVPLSVQCVSSSSTQEACDTFQFLTLNARTDRWDGNLYLAKALDYARISTYTLQLSATDNQGAPTYKSLTINVLPVRQRPPQFVGTYNVEISERTAASSEVILKVQAIPFDTNNNYPIRYRILTGTFSSYFTINEVSGALTNIKPLQYSDPAFDSGVAVVQIEAAYVIGNVPFWGNSSASSVVNASIYLSGSNLFQPTFDKSLYTGSVKETALPGTFVDSIFVTVTDLDKSLSASSFSLSLDRETDKFEVRPIWGFKHLEARISVVSSAQFNYNDGPRWYTFNIIAVESASAEKKSSQAMVNVSLVQVNRYPPTFLENPYNVSVSETAPVGTIVVQVQAWDKDVGPIFGNESIKYRLAQGPRDLFRMNDQGLITVAPCRTPGKYPCLDYEREDMRSVRLVVFAMDIKGEGLTGTTTVIINVLNENDNPPIFSYNEYQGYIEDNTTLLTILPSPINATDLDGDPIKFTIRAGNVGNLWNINPSTGQLTPVRPILYTDAPVNGTFHLIIEASDGLPAHNALANVIITVKPINRYPPEFSQEIYNITIPQNTPIGAEVFQVVAIDKDPPGTPGGTVIYRLISGGLDTFDVNPNTGKITLKTPLNQAITPTYSLVIEATDQGVPQKRDETTVIINISPISSLSVPSTDVVINDGLPINSDVTTVKATTQVQNPQLQYTFIGPTVGFDTNMNPIPDMTNDEQDKFRIDPNSGLIRVNKPLNSERIPIWRTVVQVSERTSNPPLTATATVTIRMYPVNKKPPVFNPPWTPTVPFYNITVDQGNITRPEVATFGALSPNQSLTILYELVDPKNYFKLQSPTSGIVLQQTPFFDQTTNYSFLVIAKDNGLPPLSSTATINVAVNPKNMYAPEFEQSIYKATINETTPPGTSVLQVRAMDRDTGNFGVVRYSIETSAARQSFAIDPITGWITVVSNNNLDANKQPTVEFYVNAADSPNDTVNQRVSSAYVIITILDFNNHPPVFLYPEYRIQIVDTTPPQSFVIQALATDGDLGENARLTYSVLSGNNEGLFSISPTNGSIYVAKSLKSAISSQYVLNVSASDNGIPQLSSSCLVYIMITSTCGSLCDPVWVTPSTLSSTVNVSEDVKVGTVVYVLAANNYKNEASSMMYSLTPTPGDFALNSTVGRSVGLVTNKALNYNLVKSYSLQAGVSDTTFPGSPVIRYITVNVVPVRNLNPQFPFDPNTNCTLAIWLNVPYYATANTLVTQLNAATKYSEDKVSYSIIDPAGGLPFRLDSNTGQLYVSAPLVKDRMYNLTVNAMNTASNKVKQETILCGNQYDQSNVSIHINITSPAPQFASNEINFCVDKGTRRDTTVLVLNEQLAGGSSETVRYVASTSPLKYFKVQYYGSIDLIDDASAVTESSVSFDVLSYFANYPNNSQKLTLTAYMVERARDLTLVTVKKPISLMSTPEFQQSFINAVRKESEGGIVCFVDATYHATEQGSFNAEWTDVFLYVINGRTHNVVPPLALNDAFATKDQRAQADIIGITGAVMKWDGFNYKPVAIAIGLIIGLLLLCLLFFCCCCLWPYIAGCCIKAHEGEPSIAKSMISGAVNREWAMNPQLQEQQHLSLDVPEADGTLSKSVAMHGQYGQDFGDADILAADSFKSTVRREDSATVDGALSNEGAHLAVPSGYVHIEAPLSPSRSASAIGASDAYRGVLADANRTQAETTLHESYESGPLYGNVNGRAATRTGREEFGGQPPYSRVGGRSSRIGTMDGDEHQGPVQLNEVGPGGTSRIGATLIKPESTRALGQIQNIISGNDQRFDSNSQLPGYEYSNYDSTFINDPSRSNMAYSNEVVFSGLRPVSHYEEMEGTLPARRSDLVMNPMTGGNRQESRFMEHMEETRFF